MGRTRITAILPAAVLTVGAWFCGSAGRSVADETVPTGSGPIRVAVIDVAAVFKSCPEFLDAMKEVQADSKKAAEVIKRQEEELAALMQQLKALPPRSPEAAALEREIDRSPWKRALTCRQDKTFTLRESKILHQCYEKIAREVAAYCKARNIDVVFRVTTTPVKAETPEDVPRQVNKPVVWFAPTLDITPDIIGRMKKPLPKGQLQIEDCKLQTAT